MSISHQSTPFGAKTTPLRTSFHLFRTTHKSGTKIRSKKQAWISLGGVVLSITVLSAVDEIRLASSAMTEERIVWTSVAILIVLFMVQRFGTDKVGCIFAPVLCVWFALIGSVGLYNIIMHDPSVVKAVNPKYIVNYFVRNKKEAWISLGGVVLSITGTEALFADVGHFTVKSVQISACAVVYPALILAYTGQSSFLLKNNHAVSDAFYASIPGPIYWPMFVVALVASVTASQALITGSFTIIQQSMALGCFPRVKIVHTSTKHERQIYIPTINYLLMLACIVLTLGFRTPERIGNAYGIAVVFVMILTSAFLVLIMTMIWKVPAPLTATYVLIIGGVEFVYLTAVFYKFNQGGYLPVSFATILLTVKFSWSYVNMKKYQFELDRKIASEKAMEIIAENNSRRLPGVAVFYSETAHGIPPIFDHYIANIPAIHSVLVFCVLQICRYQ